MSCRQFLFTLMFEKLSATFKQFLLTVVKKFSAIFGHLSSAALYTGMKVFWLLTKIPLSEGRVCWFWDQCRCSEKSCPTIFGWVGSMAFDHFAIFAAHISTISRELISRTNDNAFCLRSFKQSWWKISSLTCYLFIKITHKFCRQIMKF